MHDFIKIVGALLLSGSMLFVSGHAFAQATKDVDVHALLQKATVSFSPRTGSFTEGSTFVVSIMLDTKGQSVNAVELHVGFNPKKLQIVEPAGQQSIIGLWVEPPVYSNTFGTLKLVGTIPGGVNTQSGVIANITFKALTSGSTRLTISPRSQVLANDGLGTPVVASFGDAFYTLSLQPPEGPTVFSETHPFSNQWYNNDSPVMNWDEVPGVTGYSYVVDDQPFTVPDNAVNTVDNRISLPSLPNGISYFHIKARKGSIWGGTTNVPIRIDALPPAAFAPTHEKLASGSTLISFFTTDSLSGVDHYEVGVIDIGESPDMAPIFVQTGSPFQLPTKTSGDMRVVVRAVDAAGNVRDGRIDISGFSYLGFVRDNLAVFVSIALFLITVFVLVMHYLFVRRVSRALRMAMSTPQEALAVPRYRELPPQPPEPAQPPYEEKIPTELDVLHTQAAPSLENIYSATRIPPRRRF